MLLGCEYAQVWNFGNPGAPNKSQHNEFIQLFKEADNTGKRGKRIYQDSKHGIIMHEHAFMV